jgi:S1-C subfamily serine protease
MLRVLLVLVFSLPALGQDAPCVRVQRESDTPYMVGTGSGTVVGRDNTHSFILTCRHVVPDGQKALSVFTGGTQYSADFVRADTVADLALVKVRAQFPVANVADTQPAKGMLVSKWGCPRGGPPVGTAGPVGDVYRLTMAGLTTDWQRIEMDMRGGDSGSGVFYQGSLVGVAAGGPIHEPCNYTLAVRLADVRRFLNAKGK